MIVNNISVMVLFLISARVYSAILRLPCAKYADFCIIEGDKRMEGHVLMEIRNTDDSQCTVECVQQPKCRSYNLERNERICQLNSKALADEGTILVSKPGWVYRSTDYNSTLLGPLCEELNPCDPGILCKDSCDFPFYECIRCDKYHYGLYCDRRKDLDECASSPCENGATCNDLVADYSCICVPGFTGKNCQTDIDECASLPCANGGTCSNELNRFNCTCAAGYTGVNCFLDLNECLSNPCLNGATCVNKFNAYECKCFPGYSGINCETIVLYDSCNEMKTAFPAAVDGVFLLRSGKHRCVMGDVTGCDGGGWTLIMKTDGTKETFRGAAPFWTNENVYNVENGLKSFEDIEAKFAGFSKIGFTSMCVGLKQTSGQIKWLKIYQAGTSLLEFFQKPYYQPTKRGRASWMALFPSHHRLQNYCNREGFNVVRDNGQMLLRIGIIANNENECQSPDSYTGFGSFWKMQSNLFFTTGSVYHSAMGYILVR